MWIFLPFGFFSAVWCASPDRYEVAADPSKMDDDFKKKHALFPNGAMMIRARTEVHLQMLLGDLATAMISLKNSENESNRALWDKWDKQFGFTQDSLDFEMDIEDAVFGGVQTMFPILEQLGSDYRWRIFMERDLWAFYMFHVNSRIDYSNFKNEAKRFANVMGEMDFQDKRYMSALTRVWSVMYGLQNDVSPRTNQTVFAFPSEDQREARENGWWVDASYSPTSGEEQ